MGGGSMYSMMEGVTVTSMRQYVENQARKLTVFSPTKGHRGNVTIMVPIVITQKGVARNCG